MKNLSLSMNIPNQEKESKLLEEGENIKLINEWMKKQIFKNLRQKKDFNEK